MLTQGANGILHASLLSTVPGLIHGFSSRRLGDGRKDSVKQDIYTTLGVTGAMVMGAQVHGNRVAVVSDTSQGRVDDVDAVVSLPGNVGAFPAVRTADCVPILFVDPKRRIVAAAHAGWRGTKENIAAQTIRSMEQAGSSRSDILVGIGPHIGMCCYTVPKDRSDAFSALYPGDMKVTSQYQDMWHLDIGWVNYRQLRDGGIMPEHIDAPPVCTSCQIDTFYSYRKDTKETFGEMVSLIGWNDTGSSV